MFKDNPFNEYIRPARKPIKLNSFQIWLIAKNRLRIIWSSNDRNNPIYMQRYFLWRPNKKENNGKANLFLHKICRSDRERDLHDHPWTWASLIVWGKYREVTKNSEVLESGWITMNESKIWRFLSFRRGVARDSHRLELIKNKPVWSLFWHGKRMQMWGFYVDGKKVYWREYLNDWPEDITESQKAQKLLAFAEQENKVLAS